MDILANITHEPLKLCRENPIVVNIDAAPPTVVVRSGLRYSLELYAPAYYLSSQWKKVETFFATEEPPSEIGGTSILPGAFVEIQQHLDSLLFVTPPKFGQSSISVCDGLTSPFYTRAIVKNGSSVVYDSITPTGYAYKGGVAMSDYADYKDIFFTNFIGSGRKFLSWQSTTKKVFPSSPEFLYFITNFSPLPTSFKTRVKVFYDDNTNETITIQTFQGITAFTVYSIPVGPLALGLDKLTKVVTSYEVWLCNQDCERLSEIRTYQLETKYRKNIKHILFSGSLGNFDTLTCVGKATENFKVTRQTSERYSGFDYLPNFSEKVVSKATGEREIVINTGWINKAQADYLIELLLSRDIFITTDREFLPLTLTNDTYTVSDTDEFLVARQFIFSYTNAEKNYSKLPIAPPKVQQPTGWKAYIFGSCLLNANGKRIGRQGVSMLEKYYLSSGQSVRPQVVKRNIPGTEGYIDSIPTNACNVTPFLNTVIVREGSYNRSNCQTGFGGGTATITISASLYGSELNQADADAKAESTFARTDTQAFADQHGVCLSAPQYYSVVGIPVGKWNYRISPNAVNTNEAILGGRAAYTGSQSDTFFGNHWSMGGQVDNVNIFPQGSNNLILPCDPANSQPYFVQVTGWNMERIVTIYVNGTVAVTQTITPANFQENGGSYRVSLPLIIPSKATIYVNIE
jgi:hypothetical protein